MVLSKKVNENRLTEQQYRDIREAINYSALRTYVSSRQRFYKEYVLLESRDDDQSAEIIIGSMGHVLLAAKEGEFDSRYILAQSKEPVGQMADLVQCLYKVSLRSLSEDGKQTRAFEQLFLDAVQECKYDRDMKEVAFKGKDVSKILAMFTETDKNGCCPEVYFKELLDHTGKTVVTTGQIMAAEKAVELLKTHPFTQEVVNVQSGDGIEVFNELPILWKWRDVPCKSMVDKLIIDHENQVVMPVDWKFTWDENFSYSYVKNKYWLQVGMYNAAVVYWLEEHGLGNYKLAPMQYVIIDPAGNSAPLVYQLTEEDVLNAMNGFTVRNIRYPGVIEVLENIQYHLEHAMWNCPVEAHKNNGKMKLTLQYE